MELRKISRRCSYCISYGTGRRSFVFVLYYIVVAGDGKEMYKGL